MATRHQNDTDNKMRQREDQKNKDNVKKGKKEDFIIHMISRPLRQSQYRHTHP